MSNISEAIKWMCEIIARDKRDEKLLETKLGRLLLGKQRVGELITERQFKRMMKEIEIDI